MEAQKTVEAKPVQAPKAPVAPREPKTFSVRLVSGAESLLLIASKTGTGFWRTEAVVRANKMNTRGATQEHKDAERARACLERMAADAVTAGWQRTLSKGGFRRPADAFAAIPKPGAVSKKTSK